MEEQTTRHFYGALQTLLLTRWTIRTAPMRTGRLPQVTSSPETTVTLTATTLACLKCTNRPETWEALSPEITEVLSPSIPMGVTHLIPAAIFSLLPLARWPRRVSPIPSVT